jgi:ParB-like chromosome segregation protein Spo0J
MMKKPLQSTPLQGEIAGIDLNPGPFCMSFNFDMGLLKASIERFGILNPPYLLRHSDDSFRVVAGYRRLLAARELGWSCTDCRVLPNSFPPLEALLLNLYDNLTQRKLNDVEKAMVLQRLSHFINPEEIVARFMPLLEIPSNQKTLDLFLGLEELEDPIRVSVARERVSMRVAGLMRNLDTDDRLKINELFTALKLSFNQQWEVIQWIVESASREGRSPKKILEEDALIEIMNNSEMSNPIKSKTIIKILRKRRFPSVVKAETAFKKGVSRLSLPQGLKIIPPPFFEGKKYRLEIGFSQGEELKEKVESLFHQSGLEQITDFWKGTN